MTLIHTRPHVPGRAGGFDGGGDDEDGGNDVKGVIIKPSHVTSLIKKHLIKIYPIKKSDNNHLEPNIANLDVRSLRRRLPALLHQLMCITTSLTSQFFLHRCFFFIRAHICHRYHRLYPWGKICVEKK